MIAPVPLEERLARIGLSRIVEPGHPKVYAAVQQAGAVEVWRALRQGLAAGDVSLALRSGAAHRGQGYDPEQDLRRLQRCGGRVVVPGDDEWPERQLSWRLDLMHDAPPLALYVRGPHRLDEGGRALRGDRRCAGRDRVRRARLRHPRARGHGARRRRS
jgi:DNA processing protein